MAKILVIDDSGLGSWVLTSMLQNAGHEVTAVSSQDEAFAAASQDFDCFVCDMMLRRRPTDIPDSATLGGAVVIQYLRKKSATADKPIIVISKRGDLDFVVGEQLKPYHIEGSLLIPCSEAELAAAVSEALAGARAETASARRRRSR